MARHLIPSNATIKAISEGDPRSRVNDGDGLCLLEFVKGGSHSWRFDYPIDGRRKSLSFGPYPDTTLSLARKLADEARQQVRGGVDPAICEGRSELRPDFIVIAEGRQVRRVWWRREPAGGRFQQGELAPPAGPRPCLRDWA
jgi:hypothetical protein